MPSVLIIGREGQLADLIAQLFRSSRFSVKRAIGPTPDPGAPEVVVVIQNGCRVAPSSSKDSRGVEFDPVFSAVSRNGWRAELGHIEYALLRLLYRDLTKVWSRRDLSLNLGMSEARDQTINVIVHRLRRDLGANSPFKVRTLAGKGYRLVFRPD